MKINKRFNRVEEFDPNKIIRTCIRAGASEILAKEIADEISERVYEGINTSEILKMVKKLLLREGKGLAAKYNLKDSLMRLGPTGYPFENFIAELLGCYGYKTKIRQLVKGKCVIHEIDVIIEIEENNKRRKSLIEAKFRNDKQIYLGLKHILYTYSRFLDINEGFEIESKEKFDDIWIICNTKASDEAKQFAKCRGMKLITWDYPIGQSISDMINEKHVYPLTLLNTISKDLIIKLAQNQIMFIRDILNYEPIYLMKKYKINKRKMKNIFEEAYDVLSIKNIKIR